MSNWQLSTPVALFIYIRPDTTELVFAEIARAKPPILLVVADGPPTDNRAAAEKCAATRAIVERVDWPCVVHTNYSDVNLGLKHRISSGLDWVFETVEEAIVLEDDCLPDPTFFRFCEELLERYRNDTRIMMISGNNWQRGQRRTDHSYYFSLFPHVWGWASWRRAWALYDVEMTNWPEIRNDGWLSDILHDAPTLKHWTLIFEEVHGGKIDMWAYQMFFSAWSQSALSILPNVNLVTNVGMGHSDAVHTTWADSGLQVEAQSLEFPISHPKFVIRDSVADEITQRTHFRQPRVGRVRKKWRKLRKLFGYLGPQV